MKEMLIIRCTCILVISDVLKNITGKTFTPFLVSQLLLTLLIYSSLLARWQQKLKKKNTEFRRVVLILRQVAKENISWNLKIRTIWENVNFASCETQSHKARV